MKKFLAIFLAACMCFSLAACTRVHTDGDGGTGGQTHVHSYALEWSSDEEEHWHAATCGHSQERKDVAVHQYKDGKCSICNYFHVSHTFGPYTISENSHSHTCSICGWTESGAHSYQNGSCLNCGAKQKLYTESEDGSLILFGEYPQTGITDENDAEGTLRSHLAAAAGDLPSSEDSKKWTSYRYYLNNEVSDYMWYIDVEYDGERYRGVYFTSYRPSSTDVKSDGLNAGNFYNKQDDNGYMIGQLYWFRFEPIQWRVLEKKDGTAFLLANMILDAQQFYHSKAQRTENGTIYSNNYRESDIRAWLCNTFYETAFNEAAQTLIEATMVDNGENSTVVGGSDNPYFCEDTTDKVFLLSYADVCNSDYGFENGDLASDTRRMQTTDYAKAQGIKNYDGYSQWLLRSPYYQRDNSVGFADFDGPTGYGVGTTGLYGVVPALRIKL